MSVQGRRPLVSLVIPAKNEAGNIATVLNRVPELVEEVILVDGLSTDGTVEIARRMRPDIIVVHDDEPGKGAALRAGFSRARGQYVVIIDADGSMDPLEVIRYVTLLVSGYDLVKGSRFMAGGLSTDITAIRKAGNWGLTKLCNGLFRQRFTDLCYGYLAFDLDRMQEIGLDSTGFEIEAEIVARSAMNGLRITEVPTFEVPRLTGVSNLNAMRDGMRILRTLLKVRAEGSRLPAPVPSPEPLAAYIDLTDADNPAVSFSSNGETVPGPTPFMLPSGIEATG